MAGAQDETRDDREITEAAKTEHKEDSLKK